MSSEDKSPTSEPPKSLGVGGTSFPWRRRRLMGRALGWIALALLLLTIPNGCVPLARRVRLVVNGRGREIRTPRGTVIGILNGEGLRVRPEDAVHPSPSTVVASGGTIILEQARQVIVTADGKAHHLRTRTQSAKKLLGEMGIILRPQDRMLVNGRRVSDPPMSEGGPLAAVGLTGSLSAVETRRISSPGPRPASFTAPAPRPASFTAPAPLRVEVVRAVPLYVKDATFDCPDHNPGIRKDEGEERHILSAAATVGEALYEAGIPIYRGDQVKPPLDSPVTAGLRVLIQRAIPIIIQVDGGVIRTRTRGETVADVLTQEEVPLWDQDYVTPSESTPLSAGMTIRVVRVREETLIEQESIPFETEWAPDPDMELDQRRVERAGQLGIIARRFRIHYEDGQVITRTLEEEWRAQEPQPRLIAYGTKVVSRQVDTPNGPRSYWRKVRVLVTSYSAATAGKSSDHPLYGITRLGWKMHRGIIAVDSRVINFGTRIYVPGYGVGEAGDTGGKIRGRHIDLGYNESDLKLWYRWVDVYLLDPPPPRHKIHWVLPDWPKER
ncbi:MAG: ubiquitin-like domain-containing protein [Chloroflexota bacterium]|nr:ubiquitin-like domain-containing protein [Chloroflexota bacterium]